MRFRSPLEGSPAAAEATGGLSANLAGILCIVGAGAAFVTNDMLIKWLSGDYPLHEIVLVRSLIALLLTLGFLVPLEGGFRILRTARWPLHLMRGVVIVIANLAYFAGLASLPLGEAASIFFVAPLFITALSAILLAERVGIRRWGAVLFGFTGVIVIIRPGSAAFQVLALLPLLAAFCYALSGILARRLGIRERASTMAVYIQVCFVIVCTCFGLVAGDGRFASPDAGPNVSFLLRAWTWPSLGDSAIMVGLGFLSGTGGYLMSQGYRISEAGVVAPFEYTALPLAIFWSVLVWGDWPDALAWTGIALICGAGLYVFYRESAIGRKPTLPRSIPRMR